MCDLGFALVWYDFKVIREIFRSIDGKRIILLEIRVYGLK